MKNDQTVSLKERFGKRLINNPDPLLQEIGLRMVIEAIKEDNQTIARRIVNEVNR